MIALLLKDFCSNLFFVKLFRSEQMTGDNDSVMSSNGGSSVRSSSATRSTGAGSIIRQSTLRMKTPHTKTLNLGDANDDVHVGILCLRAVMNHQVMLHNALKLT